MKTFRKILCGLLALAAVLTALIFRKYLISGMTKGSVKG